MRSNASRVACVLIHHLPLQLEQRLDPTLLDAPAIISGIAWKPDVVLDASPQAEQLCPMARVIPPREELYYAQHDTALRVCQQFSPQIETAGLGFFFLDVSGMCGTQALYPSEHAKRLAVAVLNTITQHTNLAARIGIAGNKFAAEQATRHVVDATGRPKLLQWGGWTRIVAGVLDHWRTASRWWQPVQDRIEREHYLVQTQYGSTYSVYTQDQRWYVDRKYPR